MTSGFRFNCHYDGKETELVLRKIVNIKTKEKSEASNNSKIKFIKQGQVANCIVDTGDNNKITISKGMKMIFRKEDNTIGFGKVLKIGK